MVCPVIRAHRKITAEATPNRMAAVVNTPRPEKVSFMATELEPNRIHKKIINTAAATGRSLLDGCWSAISLQSLAICIRNLSPGKLHYIAGFDKKIGRYFWGCYLNENFDKNMRV